MSLPDSPSHPFSHLQLWDFLPLAFILTVGGFLRLYSLETHSLLIDEAFIAVGARDIAFNHTPIWDASSVGPYCWLQAFVYTTFGDGGAWSIRIMPSIEGILSVWLVYLIARRLGNKKLALLSAGILGLHPFAIAFARIGFVDTLQLLLILVAIYLGELLHENRSNKSLLLIAIGLTWCAAFLVKFNAPVFALAWFISGLAAHRLRLKDVAMQTISMLACIGLALFFWRYGLVPWFAAFLLHGASYNLLYSISFFSKHAQQAFLGITLPALLGSLAVGYFRRESKDATPLVHVALATLIYLVEVLILGRPFQRYLLVCTPMVALLLPRLIHVLWKDSSAMRLNNQRKAAIALQISCGLLSVIAVSTTVTLSSHYLQYLKNDVNVEQIVQQALHERTPDTRIYWATAEPLAAYYSGFSQQYSRASHNWQGDSLGYRTYTEGMHASYASDTLPYRVRVAQDELRKVGYLHLITHTEYIDTIVDDATHERSHRDDLRFGNYLNDSTIRPGDLLIMFGGESSLNGEPRFESLDTSRNIPAYLPLRTFDVVRSFRRSGETAANDTVVYPYTAGAWLLRRR